MKIRTINKINNELKEIQLPNIQINETKNLTDKVSQNKIYNKIMDHDNQLLFECQNKEKDLIFFKYEFVQKLNDNHNIYEDLTKTELIISYYEIKDGNTFITSILKNSLTNSSLKKYFSKEYKKNKELPKNNEIEYTIINLDDQFYLIKYIFTNSQFEEKEHCSINGNYYLNIFTDFDGLRTTQRLSNSNESQIPEYPELLDLKITNECLVGCKWCYQDSKKEIDTVEDNFNFIKEIIDQLPSFVDLAIGGGDVLAFKKTDELLSLINRFPSRNFTINAKSLKLTKLNNETGKLMKENLDKMLPFASQVGISVTDSNEIRNVHNFYLENYPFEINKICYHIIPDLMTFTSLKEALNTIEELGGDVLLLGYKEYGRGVDYNKYTNAHDIKELKKLVYSYTKCGYRLKIDTKLKNDYDFNDILIYEGEYSCNVDAPLKTMSVSSWKNKEQFYNGSFVESFAKIRKHQGFETT